jgi:hypothetical protein
LLKEYRSDRGPVRLGVSVGVVPASSRSASPGSPGARRPIFRHPWRIAIVIGVLVVVANLAIIINAVSDTSDKSRVFPSEVENVNPPPNSVTGPIDTVSADLRNDLTGVLIIDRQEVPEDQLTRDSLAVVSFRPGPGKDLRRFSAGTHQVTVLYWGATKPRPKHPAGYSWSFRAAA